MQHHIITLLDREMDRKDFLKYMAVAGFMMFGGGAIVRMLRNLGTAPTKRSSKDSRAYGFGSGPYGV